MNTRNLSEGQELTADEIIDRYTSAEAKDNLRVMSKALAEYRAVTCKLLELLSDEVGEYNVVTALEKSGVVPYDSLRRIIVSYQIDNEMSAQ